MGGSVFIGRVVSNRMQKTVVVAVSYVVWVPKYKVYEKRVSRHMAHDANQECVVGDLVKINVTRKMSKHKSYKVTSVLKRTPVLTPLAAQGAIPGGGKPLGAVEAALARVDAARERLAAVKRMYELELGVAPGTAPLGSAPGTGLEAGQASPGQQAGSSHASADTSQGEGQAVQGGESEPGDVQGVQQQEGMADSRSGVGRPAGQQPTSSQTPVPTGPDLVRP